MDWLSNDKGKSYNLCHFWSKLVSQLALPPLLARFIFYCLQLRDWQSKLFALESLLRLFRLVGVGCSVVLLKLNCFALQSLDRSGGFSYERWVRCRYVFLPIWTRLTAVLCSG